MRHLHVITGSCPQTGAQARIGMAEIAEAEGRTRDALEWRAVVARWRREYRQRGPATPAGDPDALVEPIATPEHPMFWHDTEATGVVCPCGHFATLLCDEPMGRGRTCDLPLCRCCALAIGDDLDLCRVHAERQLPPTTATHTRT